MNTKYKQIEINKYRDHIWSVDMLVLLAGVTEVSVTEYYPWINMTQPRKNFLKLIY